MAAIPGEIAKVSGVSPKAANANTAPDAISTKYAPGATSGTVRVVDTAPLPSEVTSEAPKQPAGDALKQTVRAVLAAYPAPVAVMRVPTGPVLGDRTRVGGSAVEPDGAAAIAPLFGSACPAPLEIRRTKIIAPVTGDPPHAHRREPILHRPGGPAQDFSPLVDYYALVQDVEHYRVEATEFLLRHRVEGDVRAEAVAEEEGLLTPHVHRAHGNVGHPR